LIYGNPQEYVERRAYRSLNNYAEGIQRFERQLRLPVSAFLDILKEEKETDLEEGSTATNEL
jgi:hypothetical protein